ncbi:Trafficking protein particle complex subunit 13 [Amphibalanus amphitrite]|uniref:Trafficking protein particle complex subunit 13 n=1 Tax=Amphibalanus amphitrite TaxID=1232801 RepID=A0A6A4WA87_AMPAM|nr:trafficking protein particle complex subunit 13-like isoform X2 [Amphibalanus amphitrite]XP_043217738.1 trafficking protein particle complex subunit 13-like isoform X2 [Amphibalanus amphitrite]KAF0298761.1 Trafficking protein particle complex subunit 13 [Amphibalanus amphitrite]
MDNKEEHIVALKVMRLTRPTLYSNPVVSCDPRDLPGTTLSAAPDVTRLPHLPHLQLGEMLLLPQSFGSIYLGETFSCYLSVHNHSTGATACELTVRAELQTGSQRLTLTPTAGADRPASLAPAASRDHLIQHEVKDTGAHILVCAINYTTEAGVNMFFRKFFKFEVLKPLDVKTKLYNGESDEVCLEAQIQNVTPSAICMETVTLEPSPLFDAVDLNTSAEGDGSVFGASGWLGPQDSRQYLFCLRPRPELRLASAKQLKGVTNMGKLDITWRTNLGERGRLQTSQLQRMAPTYGDLRLTIEDIPSVVALDQTFTFTCRVHNASDRTLALALRLETPSAGLVWRGVSGRPLGRLAAGASATVPLTLTARRLGLQPVTGVRLLDAALNRPYDYDNLAQVFVAAPAPAERQPETAAC